MESACDLDRDRMLDTRGSIVESKDHRHSIRES